MHDEHGLLTLLKYIQPYIEMQRHLGAHRVSDYSIDVEKKPLSLELLFQVFTYFVVVDDAFAIYRVLRYDPAPARRSDTPS